MMLEYNSFGYIFSGDELIYLLGMMGANYVLGVEEINETVSIDKLDESLLEKGYVFRNFDNELILNTDIAEILRPMAELSKFISLKSKNDEGRLTIYFYVNDYGVTVNEVNSISPNKHIVSYSKERSDIYEILKEKINIRHSVPPDDKTIIKVGLAQLEQLKAMESKTDMENCLQGYGLPEQKRKFIVDFVTGMADTFTIVLFDDIKNKPKNMKSLMFVDNNDMSMKPETIEDKVVFRSISIRQIYEEVRSALSKCLHREIENKKTLFN